ncbi:RNA polymerase sigma factor [Pendulispora albinea]|uniref:RNA polymerase sigma factor n=1 Tax=Pendulispora albinea TaxID=2741071 RepID=A0ABZ2LZ34_9BACT
MSPDGRKSGGALTNPEESISPASTAAATAARTLSTGALVVPAADDTILADAIRGNTSAFRALYARHRTDVARLVYRMLGVSADLDDVVQEVFFQVYRSLKDFRGQSKFSTWLHRVTVNVVLMHRRAARSRPMLTDEAPPDLNPDTRVALPDEDAARRERVRAFSRLLERLPEKKRIVFILHELEGIAPSEIAKIVEAPVLTVRTRLFYARREIEAMLADEPSLAGLKSLVDVEGDVDVKDGGGT